MSNGKKTFTLNDLELDQVVETRDGFWYIVCKTKKGVVLSCERGWISLNDVYTDDLTDMDGYYENDIMKVWDITKDGDNAHAVSPENRELIWEREEDDEEIEATKKEAKEVADRAVAERKESGVKVNVDVDAEIEDMLRDLDDMLSIASAMTRLNEKYGK